MPTATVTPALAAPLDDPAEVHALAKELGFTFRQLPDGRVFHLGPAAPPPGKGRQVARVREQLARNDFAEKVYAVAHQPVAGGLSKPPPPPRRKPGFHPLTGERMVLPDEPPPPAPLPPPPPKREPTSPSLLWTLEDCDRELAQITRAMKVQQGLLDMMPEETENEPFELQRKRSHCFRQLGQLNEWYCLIQGRWSELLMAHVDAVALQRERAAGPKVVVNWGRMWPHS